MIFINPKTECLVFRTNLQDKTDVKRITETLNNIPGIHDWSVDLEDWEKVLRIECSGINSSEIKNILRSRGVHCKELPM